jgi:ATP-binding cassette subfamily B protein
VRKQGFFATYRPLLPYLKAYIPRYILGFLFLLLVDGANIVIPQCLRLAVDLLSAADNGTFKVSDVYPLAAAILGLAVVIGFGRFLWRYFIHGSSRRIEAELRRKLFDHLLTLSYDFYQKNKIGDLMARATNDLNAVRNAIGMGFVTFIDGTVMAAAILVVMFTGDAKTAALAIIPLPVITLLMLAFGSAIGRLFQRAQETYSAMSDTVQETFAGIRVVKSFVKEWWFIRKFADTSQNYMGANMSLVKIFGAFFPIISFLSGVSALIVLLVGGAKVRAGIMTTGELAAFLTYMQMLIWPVLSIGFTVNAMQRGAASLARINELFAEKPAIASPEQSEALSLKTAEPAIVLRDLTFAYPSAQTGAPAPVLSGINLAIPQGAAVGILGKTGSGKSTLLKMFMRLLDPPPGAVFVYGKDVRSLELADLRSLFAVVPQDTYLFSDSVKQNIAYGVDQARTAAGPDEDSILREAADISAIAKDLEDFAGGWETLVGERGLTLSGGQKQRVAIARAQASAMAASAPRILILDDALSAVDAQTERNILRKLMEKRRGQTTLLVSHRVSTLQNADFVIVLEGGKIAERGSPRELMGRNGFFAHMARLQKLEEG